VGVGLAAVLIAAAAESLRLREQLDVDLKPDDRLVLGEDFRGERSHGGHTIAILSRSAVFPNLVWRAGNRRDRI
jgi:hypothetical protein